MQFHEALIHYIKAHYIEIELPEHYDEEIFLDHMKWQGEIEWILQSQFGDELKEFFERLGGS
ncbi:MAG: hypothetical protein CL509_06035 [Actinobacteria bacterium]|nr:hypothetical protein [Actinomycetota bacterium]|tara:strand:- start:1897 stop:2082 length:186 start_codon:yes stop_codon:yes gene_type:complete